jgi:hypothetical protein
MFCARLLGKVYTLAYRASILRWSDMSNTQALCSCPRVTGLLQFRCLLHAPSNSHCTLEVLSSLDVHRLITSGTDSHGEPAHERRHGL